MKKLLGIVVLGLLLCNVVSAEVLTLKNCYPYAGNLMSSEDIGKFNSNKWEKKQYTINFDTGSVSGLFVRTDKEMQKLKEKGDWAYKQSHKIYTVVHFDEDSVYAVKKSNVAETELRIDVFKGKVYKKSKMKKPFTVYESYIQCIPPEKTSITKSNEPTIASGTAFFINKKGYLLTNNHVVDGCVQSKINYFDKEYNAKLLAKDKILDLALLKVNLSPKSYLSFSGKIPKKLQKIYVAGYPFGKGLSDDLKITDGIISSLKGSEDNSNELQVSAPINHGNSGGPIVGEKGELIGVAVSGLAKEISEGINFGIKSTAVKNFLSANEIQSSISNNKSINNDKLLKILEESTVYTYCEIKN